MLHNKPFKKITVIGQTVNKECVLAVHNPKDIDYSGVYALKLKAADKLFRVDFSIAGDNEISYSDVNIGILNIVDNNSGIGTTQTAFNNNFTLKVVQNTAGLNLIVIRMLAVIMSGNFEMTITNSVPTGLDWSDYSKYIGKDYSTIVGYPFANETVKSPVKILGGINAPEVTTTAATSVTSSGMILNASLTTLGSEASVNVAFDWRLVGAGSWTRTGLVAKTTIGTWSATLSGLSSNTTYEYRAVVIGQSNPGNDAIGGVLPQLTVAINIDADSGVNITGTSGGSALNTTNVPSVTNGAVNNGTGLMTATADNCVSQTVEIAQQVGQSDFQLLKTTFALAPYQVAIDPASNTTTLVVTDPESGKFVNNSKFWLESAGVMKLVQAASVAQSTISITPPLSSLSGGRYSNTTINTGSDTFTAITSYTAASNIILVKWSSGTATTVTTSGGDYPAGVESYSIGGKFYVSCAFSGLNQVKTYEIVGNSLTLRDTVATGTTPMSLIYSLIGSDNVLTVCNQASSTISTYKWNPALNSGNGGWSQLGTAQSVGASPTRVRTWVIGGDTYLGSISNSGGTISVFKWNPELNSGSGGWATFTTTASVGSDPYDFVAYQIGADYYLSACVYTASRVTHLKWNGTTFAVFNSTTVASWNFNGLAVHSIGGNTYISCQGWSTAEVALLKWDGSSNFTYVTSTSVGGNAYNHNVVTYNGVLYLLVSCGNAGGSIPLLYVLPWDASFNSGNGGWKSAGSSVTGYKYTCTSLTILHGGAITTTPTLAYKAGQSFESSITATSGTTSYVADTLYSVSRSGNILTLIFNQRAATGRYAKSKAMVNKGDVISRYVIDLWN